ncbi:MAG: YybH family protein [Gemmatimonadota bacterium]
MHESEVRDAVAGFYRALNRLLEGEPGPMADVWSHADDITQMGPFGGRREGWPDVREELERTAELSTGGRVGAEDVFIHADAGLAYVVCTERGEIRDREGRTVHIRHRATLALRREEGAWKAVHRHADVAPDLQEMARRNGPFATGID